MISACTLVEKVKPQISEGMFQYACMQDRLALGKKILTSPFILYNFFAT